MVQKTERVYSPSLKLTHASQNKPPPPPITELNHHDPVANTATSQMATSHNQIAHNKRICHEQETPEYIHYDDSTYAASD